MFRDAQHMQAQGLLVVSVTSLSKYLSLWVIVSTQLDNLGDYCDAEIHGTHTEVSDFCVTNISRVIDMNRRPGMLKIGYSGETRLARHPASLPRAEKRQQ